MGSPEATAKGQGQGAPEMPAPRPGKALRVLLFFLYFFGFAVAIPMIVVAVVQARYGLIDGPPSLPEDPFGEQVKSITKYGILAPTPTRSSSTGAMPTPYGWT